MGFKNFVVTFMIFMAEISPHLPLHTSDQSPGKYIHYGWGQRKKTSPLSLSAEEVGVGPHPYVFNSDHTSMTFIGFH